MGAGKTVGSTGFAPFSESEAGAPGSNRVDGSPLIIERMIKMTIKSSELRTGIGSVALKASALKFWSPALGSILRRWSF
jgi:hypothetical protein